MRLCDKYKARTCTGVDIINASGECQLNRHQVRYLKTTVKQVRKVGPYRIDGTDTDILMNYFDSLDGVHPKTPPLSIRDLI